MGGTLSSADPARLYHRGVVRLLCLVGIVLVASVVRFDALGRPGTYVADEGFYARDGCWYVHHSSRLCGIDGEQTPEHPPLGKWLIGAGIRVFGFTPRGWRMASAIAGVATVAVLFALAAELLASTAAALLAAGLLAVEPLSVVQSRMATLDCACRCSAPRACAHACCSSKASVAFCKPGRWNQNRWQR